MPFRIQPKLTVTTADLSPDQKRAIDAETFHAVLQWWRRKSSPDAQKARSHFEAEFDRFVSKIRLDGAIHESIQVDDRMRLIKGFRRFAAALLLADSGHREVLDSLRVE